MFHLSTQNLIKAFKFRVQAIFSLLEKTPPGSQNLSSRIFFIILHYKYPKKLFNIKKLDTNSCFAKLRAISNLFSFFIHPVVRQFQSLYTPSLPRSTATPYSTSVSVPLYAITARSITNQRA